MRTLTQYFFFEIEAAHIRKGNKELPNPRYTKARAWILTAWMRIGIQLGMPDPRTLELSPKEDMRRYMGYAMYHLRQMSKHTLGTDIYGLRSDKLHDSEL